MKKIILITLASAYCFCGCSNIKSDKGEYYMSKKAVATAAAPKAIGPYSQAIDVGNAVYVSGGIPLDPATGQIIDGDIKSQTERVFKNIEAILKASGLGLNDVVRTTVYMTDLASFADMNEVYAGFFKEPFPARTTVQASALPKGAKIEIDAIAVKAKK